MEETELYVIKTTPEEAVPGWVESICTTDSEGYLKTFCELTDSQVNDLIGSGLTVEFVGKRPNDRG